MLILILIINELSCNMQGNIQELLAKIGGHLFSSSLPWQADPSTTMLCLYVCVYGTEMYAYPHSVTCVNILSLFNEPDIGIIIPQRGICICSE